MTLKSAKITIFSQLQILTDDTNLHKDRSTSTIFDQFIHTIINTQILRIHLNSLMFDSLTLT